MALQRTAALLLALATAASPLLARSSGDADDWCGTTRGMLAAAVGVHDDHSHDSPRPEDPPGGELDNGKSLSAMAARAGNIAVVTDTGTLFRQPNPVDLDNTALQFARQKKGMTATRVTRPVSATLGTKLALTDDSSVRYNFPKGFKFVFFGKSYTGLFVNSDGNLTFGAPDSLSTERGLPRFLSGPPRIAPFFTDLNAEQGGGIYVSAGKTTVTFTWKDVQEWSDHPGAPANTFQVVLDKTGKITFSYAGLGTNEAVVGIAPGGASGVDLVDFRSALPRTVTQAIAERFSLSDRLDDMAVAQAFLRTFADDYDHLVVWLDFNYVLGGGAFAYEFGVKNDIKGIGQNVFDASGEAGSHGRLRSFVQMGSLAHYPANPDEEFLRSNTTMDILGQETGHRWGAFLSFKDPHTGQVSDQLLGRAFSHWNFFFNSDASDIEGNEIQDQGGGNFRTVDSTSGFGPLDLYIMGLIDKSQVPPLFFVRSTALPRESPPAVGVGFQGQRVDLTIDDIIAAEGPRVPPSAAAPHAFKMAFVVVERAGQSPTPETLQKIEAFRTRWEAYFNTATRGLGHVDTTLRDR
jgi:hypothetical protein